MKSAFRETKSKIEFSKKQIIDFPAHLHEEIELMYVKEGECTAYVDGKEYFLTKNNFFVCFPNQVHSFEKSAAGEYLCLIIKPSQLFHYTSVFGELVPENAVCELQDQDNTEYLFYEAYSEYKRNGESSIVICYLTLLFGKLLKQYKLQKARISQDSISSILTYCANHYKENISVESVADALHISRCHLSRVFNKRINMNFCDYINSLRLIDAVNMLESKETSITEIAFSSGFSTLRTFNRAFLKRYGVSPTEYKKRDDT